MYIFHIGLHKINCQNIFTIKRLNMYYTYIYTYVIGHTVIGDARAFMLDLLGNAENRSDGGERRGNNLVVEDLRRERCGGRAARWPSRQPLRSRLEVRHRSVVTSRASPSTTFVFRFFFFLWLF